MLQKLFSEMMREGCTHVVMEVSSQAEKQHRCDGITFDYGVFTNIETTTSAPGSMHRLQNICPAKEAASHLQNRNCKPG